MSLESRPSVQVTEKCFKRVPTALTIAIVTAFAVGCGGVSPSISPSTPSPSKAPNVRISITPTAVNLSSGKQQQFSATMMFTSNTAVTWTASTGTITGNGLFTAPGVTSATNVTVTAQGRDSNNIAESQVTVFPAVKLSVASRNLPDGTAGSLYSTKLSAIGGVAPYTWSITAGSLPRGLSLDKSSGLISGAASQAGKFNFTALVTDADSTNASNSVSLAISGSNTQSAADFDGPAELPRLHVQSDLAHTPAPGTLIS